MSPTPPPPPPPPHPPTLSCRISSCATILTGLSLLIKLSEIGQRGDTRYKTSFIYIYNISKTYQFDVQPKHFSSCNHVTDYLCVIHHELNMYAACHYVINIVCDDCHVTYMLLALKNCVKSCRERGVLLCAVWRGNYRQDIRIRHAVHAFVNSYMTSYKMREEIRFHQTFSLATAFKCRKIC